MSTDTRGETFVMRDAAEPGGLGFTTFLMGLASSALIHLGAAPHPETGAISVDLLVARQTLDVLGMLREKTRGNLDPGEEKLFESLLADLRLRYVEASRKR